MGTATTATKTTWVDGFPVITTWDDPVQYSCQRNFILGIGDVNTHADKNVPGATPTGNEPAKPSAVSADTSVDAVAATHKVGALHGLGASLGTTNPYNGCCNNNSALMAGIAYDSNTRDIRPDNASIPQTVGKQTIQTYWLDILEFLTYKSNNQYYLAAKYGGAKVPDTFDPYAATADLPTAWWSTTGETVGGQARPDNYFVASRPDQMVLGLNRAFAKIAADLRAYTTSFATSLPQTAISGSASYGAQYDAGTWTGEVQANTVAFDTTTGDPTLTLQWSFSSKLAAQLSGTGWNTGRLMVSWNTASGTAVPFRHASISAAQQTALDTVYRTGDDSADYLNYLRGDPAHEESSTATGSAKIYRNRAQPVGDIVGSKVRPVGPPAAPISSAANPGYGTFKTTHASRTTLLYVGTNAGVLHAIDGS
ncbi:MAG: pilus assembly protein, partial [Rubrivivax sp.]|nr:pilus assembly protein [Rubrivivax sp.]